MSRTGQTKLVCFLAVLACRFILSHHHSPVVEADIRSRRSSGGADNRSALMQVYTRRRVSVLCLRLALRCAVIAVHRIVRSCYCSASAPRIQVRPAQLQMNLLVCDRLQAVTNRKVCLSHLHEVPLLLLGPQWWWIEGQNIEHLAKFQSSQQDGS